MKKTIHTCDGCGEEHTTEHNLKPADWCLISVGLHGFEGHPISRDLGDRTRQYDLCPNCQLKLFDVANPKNWAAEPEIDAEDTAS